MILRDIIHDKVLIRDLDNIANADIPYGLMQDATVMVTGATGLVGMSVIRALLWINDIRKTDITIVAIIRNKEKAKSLYGELFECPEIKWLVQDIVEPVLYEGKVDYIIHAASVTTSKIMVEKPVDTIVTSLLGTKNLLDYSVRAGIKSFLYISSMEMYGRFDDRGELVAEGDLGYINPLEVRSNYPESKRMCENMCIAYMKQYSLSVRIARLAQTFGAGILPGENRVFAQFAKSVINNEDIVLHTKGLSEGNYCYLSDMIQGLFTILLKGSDGEAYNVSNVKAHTTIAKMAEMVCHEIAGDRIKLVYDIPETNVFGYAQDTKIHLDNSKLKALGWSPEVDLKESYIRMIASMREIQE